MAKIDKSISKELESYFKVLAKAKGFKTYSNWILYKRNGDDFISVHYELLHRRPDTYHTGIWSVTIKGYEMDRLYWEITEAEECLTYKSDALRANGSFVVSSENIGAEKSFYVIPCKKPFDEAQITTIKEKLPLMLEYIQSCIDTFYATYRNFDEYVQHLQDQNEKNLRYKVFSLLAKGDILSVLNIAQEQAAIEKQELGKNEIGFWGMLLNFLHKNGEKTNLSLAERFKMRFKNLTYVERM